MTMTAPPLERRSSGTAVADGVYSPQHDSRLLMQAMEHSTLIPGRRVLDLCTGSGVIAIAAAQLGAVGVTAFDICPRAVGCCRRNVRDAGVTVHVRQGPWTGALRYAPFDVIVSNPPYVPTGAYPASPPAATGPRWAWDGGGDGRRVLGPLCESVADLLCDGGSMLLVQSELSGIDQSLAALQSSGLVAGVVAMQRIPFGPVLLSQTRWLEEAGWIPHGCREEQLVVIRADKP